MGEGVECERGEEGWKKRRGRQGGGVEMRGGKE